MTMKTETYVNIRTVPTKVITFGQGLFELGEGAIDVVLVIPGNPGYPALYEDFLQELHNQLKCSVWIAGYAGHDNLKQLPRPIHTVDGYERLYDLPGQVLHQVAFIEEYIPKNVRLHLIGHSAGAYMVLQLLKIPTIKSKMIGCYLLFPTLEKFGNSPSGKLINYMVKFPFWIPLAKIFVCLPERLQKLLMDAVGSVVSIPKNSRDKFRELVHPITFKIITIFGSSVINLIKVRDDATLKENVSRIKIYYGANDGFTPLEHYTDLKNSLPNIDAEICTRGYKHAFVLYHSKDVADLVANWIRKYAQPAAS